MYVNNLNKIKTTLQSDKDDALEKDTESLESLNNNMEKSGDIEKKSNKIFIVHGHDKVAKIEVARFIVKMKFEAVILHEQVNEGKTSIEKIEYNTDVDFAVVLYTPCDTYIDDKKWCLIEHVKMLCLNMGI